ncbi:hypothetical protein [Embleya hyalina]|uniref:Uncharacterized protein n=1 Tax=Embleya hyalina TaxID=516124 RepID=A0A401YYW0_9ACTN|nr:hypothetical protein [Embleya hyalina]GCD99685.1 hypothetical protein EHYA_07407 [Embleya hyalina]
MSVNPDHGGNEPFDLRTLVLLTVAGAVVYASYRNSALGAAVGIGIAVLLALHNLVKRN